MTPASFAWLVVGAVIVYAVAVDENVFTWMVLQSKALRLWFERQWFRIRHNPESPWVRYEMKRNADKIARELIKEFEKR